MSRLMVTCSHCGAQIEYAGIGSVVIVTIERWRRGGETVDRRYLCPACADEIMAWITESDHADTGDDSDLPMGG
jgi:DNA-directed RNA polymerase subunit RPC12/RpoP